MAIADTLVSLRAPPQHTHVSYPRPQSVSPIPSLAPNPIGPGETAELGSSSSESVGGSNSDETNKRTLASEVSEVRKEVSMEVENGVINVETYYSFPNITNQNCRFSYSPDQGYTWNHILVPEGSYDIDLSLIHISEPTRPY